MTKLTCVETGSALEPYVRRLICCTRLLSRMPGSICRLSLAVVAVHLVERLPINDKFRIGRRPHSHSLLQIIEANVLVCSLPAQVQAPADYIGIVHQTGHQYNNYNTVVYNIVTSHYGQ